MNWQRLRSSFIRAWEKSDKEYHVGSIERAVKMGSNAVWRLLNRSVIESTGTLIGKDDSILTNPCAIVKELKNHHIASTKEYRAVQTGEYNPMTWEYPFDSSDQVLIITDELVAANVLKLKNAAVPDTISPKLIKLLFGSADSVKPLTEMIRAVVRTRIFPGKGKAAKLTI